MRSELTIEDILTVLYFAENESRMRSNLRAWLSANKDSMMREHPRFYESYAELEYARAKFESAVSRLSDYCWLLEDQEFGTDYEGSYSPDDDILDI